MVKETIMPITPAKLLRDPAGLAAVPSDRPGWYRWWAPEAEARALLDSPHLRSKYSAGLLSLLPGGSGILAGFHGVYTGIAVKESLRARLDWHINQRHRESAVRSGTLSTLRQTLSSLLAGDQRDEAATNAFLDNLLVEYYPVDLPIGSEAARDFLESNEQKDMDERILVLNIKDNKRPEAQTFIRDLKRARKIGKTHGHTCE